MQRIYVSGNEWCLLNGYGKCLSSDGCFFSLFVGSSFVRSLTSLPRRREGDFLTERSRTLVVSLRGVNH